MHDMIKKIIDKNKPDLEERKIEKPIEELRKRVVNLDKSLDFFGVFHKFGVIAEIKLASPSAGILGIKEAVLEIAKDYFEGGAAAISVITEKHFFNGDIRFIKQIKNEVSLPILQKDFVVDAYQIYDARIAEADALLLIVKMLDQDKLTEFVELCLEVGIEPVVEISDEKDLAMAIQTKTRIIAVNARDLNNFEVDVKKACELIERIPADYLRLGFSGVNSKLESDEYKNAGANGILIGTKLMKSENKKEFLEGLK